MPSVPLCPGFPPTIKIKYYRPIGRPNYKTNDRPMLSRCNSYIITSHRPILYMIDHIGLASDETLTKSNSHSQMIDHNGTSDQCNT